MYKIHVMISGDVQGVWFRVSAQDKANMIAAIVSCTISIVAIIPLIIIYIRNNKK